jgi:hypothetical protein
MNAHSIERSLMTESNQFASSKLIRDVIALGKKQSMSGFPNPDRERCPSRSSLRAMARRDRHFALVDMPVSHIVGCSPCFTEYAHFRRMSFLWRGLRLTAASLAVLAVLFAATRLLHNPINRSRQQSASEKQIDRQPSEATSKQTIPPAAPLLVRVDLSSFSPTRGDEAEDSRNKIHLPQKLLRVRFILPLGMEPGEYEIRLQDDAGTVFINKRALGHMTNGTTSMEMNMDLAGAHRGNFTLMVHPPGEGWRKFPVVIG